MSADAQSLELALQAPLPPSTSTISNENLEHDARNESAILVPVDTGFGAWSFLTAAFFIETIVWGFPTSFGIFLDAYLQDPRFSGQKNASSLLPLVGTLSSGIIYCSGPAIYPIIARYPRYRRPFLWIGAFLCWLSLFGASYAQTVTQLLGLQGVLYAVGGALVNCSCLSCLPEWFINRRGFANGVIFAGNATGGLIIPLALPRLFSSLGMAKSLRIISIVIAIVLILFLPLVKGRIPEGRIRVFGPSPRGSRREWLKDPLFWVLMIINTLQGFAYFVPIVWLPTFASDLSLGPTNSAITLSMLNGASVVGRLSLGFLSDKLNPWSIALATLTSASLVTFILWGVLSTSFAGLLSFGVAYGMLAGGYTCLWTGFIKPIAQDDHALTTSIFGYLLLTRGLGFIISAPISSSLSTMSVYGEEFRDSTGFQIGGGRFTKMILYVGSCFAAAAMISILGRIVDARKHH